MKSFPLVMCVIFLVPLAGAWQSVAEFEAEAAGRLANGQRFVESAFTNRLHEALDASNTALRVDALLVMSVAHYQQFLDSMNGNLLDLGRANLAEAIRTTAAEPHSWQYLASRLLSAGAYAAIGDFNRSLCITTNYLGAAERRNETARTNALSEALLKYYELPSSDISEAYRVVAGMSAARLGLEAMATNFAQQVSARHRETIYEFIK